MGAEFIHADLLMDGRADRLTGMTKLIVAFRSFENAPNEVSNVCVNGIWGEILHCYLKPCIC
jgi:hypothetical protein